MYTLEIKKQKKVIVIFASISGNAQLVGEAVCDGIIESGLSSILIKAEQAKVDDLSKYDAVVLVASTWRVGLLNERMINFHKELVTRSFESKPIEVIGLGDSEHYDIFCGAADILEEAVKKVKGVQLMPTLKIDGEVFSRLDEYKDWGKNFAQKLNSYN